MKKVRAFDMHEEACEKLLNGVVNAERLKHIEAQFAEELRTDFNQKPISDHGEDFEGITNVKKIDTENEVDSPHNQHSRRTLDTLEILSTLGFGAGNTKLSLLHPLCLYPNETGESLTQHHSAVDDAASVNPFRAKVVDFAQCPQCTKMHG